MVFDYSVCDNCTAWQRHKNQCPYRNMSLLQYCDYKNIPYAFKDAGKLIIIDTSNLMSSSAMIELNNEIKRTKNELVETGYNYKIIK